LVSYTKIIAWIEDEFEVLTEVIMKGKNFWAVMP
jgi:hypothetical protein